MTDPAREPQPRGDEPTAPFMLKPTSERPDPRADDATERPGPAGDGGSANEELDPSSAQESLAVPIPLARIRSRSAELPARSGLDASGRRVLRRLASALAVETAMLLGVLVLAIARAVEHGVGAPDVLVGGLAAVLAMPSMLALASLRGVTRAEPSVAAQRIAQSLAHLRGVFVIKATLLFAVLSVGCFLFSVLVALLAAW